MGGLGQFQRIKVGNNTDKGSIELHLGSGSKHLKVIPPDTAISQELALPIPAEGLWKTDIDGKTTIEEISIDKSITWVLGNGVNVTTGVDKTNAIIVPRAGEITKVYIHAKTAPVGADLIINIRINGIGLWAVNEENKLTLIDSETSASQVIFDNKYLAVGDVITIDVEQTGIGTPGKDITVELIYSVIL